MGETCKPVQVEVNIDMKLKEDLQQINCEWIQVNQSS